MSSALELSPERDARPSPTRVPPSIEFLLVGGATLFLFPLLWLLRSAVGLDSAELAVGFLMFHGAHLINDPHFAVTYFLFYKDVRRRAFGTGFASWKQRVRYLVAGLAVPLGLGIWLYFGLSSQSTRLLGALIQVMFLLVGWHYVKQGFGVLSVLSARRGVRFSGFERRALLTHCFAGWAYAWASPAAPAVEAEEKGIIYESLAHPLLLEQVTLIIFGLSSVVLGAALYRKWRRERRLPLAPLIGLLVSVWAWTVFSSADPLLVYVIPALHSVQYLYFVWLLARNQAKAAEAAPSFGPPTRQRLALLAATAIALGWFLFHAAPDVLDGAWLTQHRHAHATVGDWGRTPYFAALFAFVNIHHYFMDNVIWRRENPDVRYLNG